ncbi:hypothetical protein N0V94_003887 [Neodidymelliopsis sp. IMI 364377]|nr:hypothetical protein N0V94_003887 [Neodidymelliopsis sp. IMI 364377]
MRFFQMVASSAAFIAAALALEINSYPSGGVKAGQTYTVTYSPADNTPTTFVLRKGLSTDLGTIGTLTSTATGGTFSWTVASDLVDGSDYALQIQQGTTINYSAQFGLTGGSGSSSAVSSASASASSASASASASHSSASSASAAYSASSAKASLSSLISSVASSVHASATASVSGHIVPSASHNGTVSSATLSTGTRGSSTATSASIPESTGAASSLSSAPLALLFGAAGAFAFLN